MHHLDIYVPDNQLKRVVQILKEFGVVIRHKNGAELKQLFKKKKKAMSEIKDPVAWQRDIRDEWER